MGSLVLEETVVGADRGGREGWAAETAAGGGFGQMGYGASSEGLGGSHGSVVKGRISNRVGRYVQYELKNNRWTVQTERLNGQLKERWRGYLGTLAL